MIIVIIAGIILAIIVFKLLLPLIGEMIGVIAAGALFLGAIALCVAFPPLFFLLIFVALVAYAKNKSKEGQ